MESDRSENLIFGNMYLSSVHKFMDFHASAAQMSEKNALWPPLQSAEPLCKLRKEVEAQLLQELMLVRKAEELNMRYAGIPVHPRAVHGSSSGSRSDRLIS